MPQFTASERWVEIWSQSWLDDDLGRAISLAFRENNPVPLIAIALSGRAEDVLAEVCANPWANYHTIRKLVHQVIIAGASTTPTTDGFPPMMAAVDRFRMNPPAIAELLKHGVPADTQPPGKWSPLRAALCAHDTQPGVIRMLLRAGADPLRADEFGTTPAEMAISHVHQIAWLRRRWADFSTPDHVLPDSQADDARRRCQVLAMIAMHLRERGLSLPDVSLDPRADPAELQFDLNLRFGHEQPSIVDGMRTTLGVFAAAGYTIPDALYAIDFAEDNSELAEKVVAIISKNPLPRDATSLVLNVVNTPRVRPSITLTAFESFPTGEDHDTWRSCSIWPERNALQSREYSFECDMLRRISETMNDAVSSPETINVVLVIYLSLLAHKSLPEAESTLLAHTPRLSIYTAGASTRRHYVGTLVAREQHGRETPRPRGGL